MDHPEHTAVLTEPQEKLEATDLKLRFLNRRKLRRDPDHASQVAQRIHELLEEERFTDLHDFLSEHYPADLADALSILTESERRATFDLLDVDEAAEVLDEIDESIEAQLIETSDPERLADILDELPADEGADLVGRLSAEDAERVLALTEAETAADIRTLLDYPSDTAGGIMSTGFVAVPEAATQAEALQLFREKGDEEALFYLYVVDDAGALQGMLNLHKLVTSGPETRVRDLMTHSVVCVPADTDQEQVASIFSRYDLTALPVVAPGNSNKLIGVITSDDIIDVIHAEATEDVMHSVGSDAHELEKRAPHEIALMRLPWIMATMFIELLAGVVIHYFDKTLTSIILLASFMPIISAISGNTGLQSATIIVRGLSTGHIQLSEWRHALARQVVTTLILGAACGISLGVIGALWYGKWTFGLVVAIGMFTSVNIAGVVGTLVPLVSKKFGFDPALTAGPFETAFQDVVGISIFLSLATFLMHWLK